MPTTLTRFRRIKVLDSEFNGREGDRCSPVCVCAREVRSGQEVRLWRDDLHRPHPFFESDPETIFVTWYGPAEWGTFLSLGWRFPTYTVDLFAEWRCLTNNRWVMAGNTLLGALVHLGLHGLTKAEKDEMRSVVLRGAPWSHAERQAILRYCMSDVDATCRLLEVMGPRLDLPAALIRGRYGQALATVEQNGIPVDKQFWDDLREEWPALSLRLIQQVDQRYGIYDGPVFREARFRQFLTRHGIPWETLPTGRLKLDDSTFRERAKVFPELLNPLRELRATLDVGGLRRLQIGSDGRTRCMLSPYKTVTARNGPSTTGYIYGPAKWVRSTIQPPPGHGLITCDWVQQEFWIAGVLSSDRAMQEAYASGDSYLWFAVKAGLAPPGATKVTHPLERDRAKALSLGVQYAMSEYGIADRINQPPAYGRELLALHKATYPRFWEWIQRVIDRALLIDQRLSTCLGWHVHYGPDALKANNLRSIQNWPMQATGSELLRVATIRAVEAGLKVVALVHDSIVVEAEAERLEVVAGQLEEIMRETGREVLGVGTLRSESNLTRYPDRCTDLKRGLRMWQSIYRLLYGRDP